jgi:gag-polypeptide of LTR copia-type
MPKTPKIGTKYDDDDLDETFQGQSTSEISNRVTRSQNSCKTNDSSVTIHDSEPEASGNDSFDTANNSDHSESNLSTTILDISSSPSPISQDSAMTLSQQQIQELIEQSIQQYAANNQAVVPRVDHAPRISNVPQLSMTNYSDWSKKIRAALILNQLWIEPTILPNSYTENQKATSKRAVQFIVMYLDANNNVHVTQENENCFYTVWNNLKVFHKPNTSMTLCDFFCSIQSLIHHDGECIRTHLMKIEQQFNKLADGVDEKDKLSGNQKVAIVLASIRKSLEFSSLFISTKWLKMETLTLSNVKDTIISAQDQLKMDSKSAAKQAHSFQFKSNRPQTQSKRAVRPHQRQPRDPARGWNCTKCEMDNHSNATCYRNVARQQTSKSNINQNRNHTQSHSASDEQQGSDVVGNAHFGTYTIKNDDHQSRERNQRHHSSIKV